MDQHCPECGAPLAPGESCQEFFERLLFEEYADMERNGPVHPQMVASFMLTHDRYSDEARPQAIALLRIALEDQPPPQHLRRVAAQLFGLDTPHKAPILRGDRPPRAIAWPITVRDVALRPDEEYPARINRWARSVLDTLAAQEE
ncbi:MAG TPA: DUF5946 family protein [Aggregatilineaceae bacterium]|jgi:hypothetical protein|nr:DUF5946 family protein [Anaerolineae bacterium]HMM27877.1 DUF5946 family protein [Aggregatilineaceae bacterium]